MAVVFGSYRERRLATMQAHGWGGIGETTPSARVLLSGGAGAAGVVLKSRPADVFLRAIRTVLAGRRLGGALHGGQCVSFRSRAR
jgi:hypothetical protein